MAENKKPVDKRPDKMKSQGQRNKEAAAQKKEEALEKHAWLKSGISETKDGKPIRYSEEIADQICTHIATGMSMHHIEKLEGMPSRRSMFVWLFKHPYFVHQFHEAQALRALVDAEDLRDIADDGRNDWMEREASDGESYLVANTEAIQRSKLRIETRKFLLKVENPTKYGTEHQKIEHTGEVKQIPDGPTTDQLRENLTLEERKELYRLQKKAYGNEPA